MALTVEDIIAAKMMAEEQAPDPAVAMAVGGAGGALLGTALGEIPHNVGRAGNWIGDLSHSPFGRHQRDPQTRERLFFDENGAEFRKRNRKSVPPSGCRGC